MNNCPELQGLNLNEQEFQLTSEYPKVYDRVIRHLPIYQEQISRYSDELPLSGCFLDAGGGTGNLAQRLINGSGQRTVTLLDQSEAMLSVAKRKKIANTTIVQGDISALSSKLNGPKYDGITCNNVLYILTPSAIKQSLKDFYSILKDEGKLIITGPRSLSKKEKNLYIEYLIKTFSKKVHQGVLSEDDAVQFINANQRLVNHFTSAYDSEFFIKLANEIGFEVVKNEKSFYIPNGDKNFHASYFIVLSKPKKVKITKAESKDVAEVLKLVKNVRSEFGFKIYNDVDSDLSDINSFYIAKGGNFFVAKNSNREVVGTIGFKPLNTKEVELTKFYIHRNYRSLKLGVKLLMKGLAYIRSSQFKSVILHTNSKLKKASEIFKSFGFVKENNPNRYVQCDISMRLNIS